MARYSKTAEKLLPHLLQEMQQVQPVIIAAAGGGAMVEHALDGDYHSGTLDESQAPWAVTTTTFGLHEADPDAHHNQSHALVGGDHTASGLTAGHVVRASGATAFAWAQLQHGDLGGVTADQHHARQHSIISASDHTISGSQFQLVGATGSNTLGLLTPSYNPGAAAAILRSSASGELELPIIIATTRVRTPLIDTASGNLTLQPAGDIILDPTDSNVLPGGSIQDDLGDYNRKWRTLYAAELYVETLVAQDVLATIGGRIMVAPTTTLIADASSGATTIDVKHNNLSNGAFVMLQTAPGGVAQFEVMKVTSSATSITGGYRYSVTRNLDGSGANGWVSGDAVANLGRAVGQGYIDLTSTSTVHSHLGPTIVIYSRTATTNWNDTKAVVALGNLRSFVGYSGDEFGLAVGNDLTLQPTTGYKGFTADRTNGVQMYNTPVSHYTGADRDVWLGGHGLYVRADDHGIIAFSTDISSEANAETHENGRIDAYLTGGDNALRLTAWDDAATSSRALLALYADAIGTGGLAQILLSAGDGTDAISLSADTISLSSGATIGGHTAWHAGNDGSGSGLDADKLDTYEATAFALLAGRAGGQGLNGGTGSGDDLYLNSTSHATKGDVLLQSDGGNVSIGNGIYAANATLEITKNGYTTVGPTMRLNNNSVGGVGDAARVEFFDAGSLRAYLEWQIISGGSPKWLFYDAFNSATRMEIGGDGLVNVGNATNTYNAKLAVSGNIHAYGGVVSADNYFQVKQRSGAPSSTTGFGRIYYDSSDDKLKYITSSGTVRTLSYT